MTICLWCDRPATNFDKRDGRSICDGCLAGVPDDQRSFYVRGVELPRKPVVLGNLNQRRKLSGWIAQIVGRLHHGQRIDKSAPWLGWDPRTGEFFWVPSVKP